MHASHLLLVVGPVSLARLSPHVTQRAVASVHTTTRAAVPPLAPDAQ